MNPISRDVLRKTYAPQAEITWREKASRLPCPYTMAMVLVIGVVAAVWSMAILFGGAR